ncbi:MAG TPA: serine/threonine-protein kinase [Gemmataceae bacterium]|nr:serine/threonine-protein kinase [Gemmataceae bacterium]
MNDRKPAELDATSGHVTSGAPPGATDRTAALEVTRDFLPAAGGAPAEHRLPVIPGYELDRELGRGAYGIVYAGRRADDPETPLAIKTIEGHGDLDRLMVEPALLARIKHPGVVGLEDYFVHDGKLVVALEFIPGGDLKPKLDRGEVFTPEQVLDFLVQIGSALAEAHSRQIVHRDLKPSNVLLDTSGGSTRYVLADFGIGRTAERVQVEKNIGGTYLYMAPEQLRGRAGPQSDLWAVGVVAYQMLTGKVPFPGPSVEELAKQIQYTDPPPPSVLIARPLPDRLEEAVLGLLRKSLSERTASAAELLSQLGVRTDVKSPISPTGVRTEAARKALPIAAKLERAARRAIVMLVLTVLVWLAMNAVLIGALFLVALWVFYYAQGRVQHRGRRVALTLAAFVLLSPRLLASFVPAVNEVLTFGLKAETANQRSLELIRDWFGPAAAMVFTVLIVALAGLSILVPVVASAAYANLRRARREQALLEAALAGQTGSDAFLKLMRDMLDTRFEDVGFHLRYAELLYARGDCRAAAVEARLITVQDPYHFDANLLLANAYHALGLHDECRQVCDDYLAVTGYGFEFQELRELCGSAEGRP